MMRPVLTDPARYLQLTSRGDESRSRRQESARQESAREVVETIPPAFNRDSTLQVDFDPAQDAPHDFAVGKK